MQATASRRRDGVEPTMAERRALQTIETFRFDLVVRRYRRDSGVDQLTGERNMRELARYLALGATAPPDRRYPMLSGPDGLDGVWHTFLMFTELYADFCGQLGRFVHHVPEDQDGPAANAVEAGEEVLSSEEYVEFLRRYRQLFGEPAPLDLWPRGWSWHVVNALWVS